uniref:Structural maintenance of chromosomes protein 6 n=1 Tax=Electrophorus electricus TaxID=8005 RepID=A0A4W4GKD9_ELEEL
MSKRKNNQILEVPSKRVRLSQPEPPDDEEERICSIQDSREVGIIENIFLRNFMCHSLLGPFTFGPNVNFVIGNNGSGKSAILTALIVGLGGKAQTTNRGSSLKGFIKEGESSAQISITMRNRGQDAYKPEVFGESITIDLRISSEGLRTYKFMSKTGQPVPYKKEELVSILDHFNIQVDNPISILTQEMSKHFLHSKGEGDKYKFFMKATQLEQMKEDYSYIMETKAMTQNTVQKHEEEMRLKFKEKEERYKNLASLDEMLQKLGELKGQMAWALVTEMEREIKNMREKIAGEEKSTIKYDQKVEEWKEKVAEAEQKYKEFHDQLESVNQRLKQLQPKCTQLKNEVQERCRARLHRHTTNLRDLERDKDQLTNRISELKYSITQSSAVSSQSRREQMNRLQTELDALNFKESTLAQQIEQFQQAYNSAKDKLNKMRSVNRRELTTLEGSRIGGLRRFGEKMPALIAAIEEANHRGHFRVKPVGPLGYCIRLRDAELCLAVESCLKSLLFAFCCDNYMDEKVLQLLMSKAFSQERRPQIIVSEFTDTLYDISTRAVRHPQYPTVLQALDIDNPVVANCLIDMRGIETILLIKNNKDARRVMQRGCPPCNCKEAFTREGDQVFNNRYYSSEQQRALYLSHDVEKEIRFALALYMEASFDKLTVSREEYEMEKQQMLTLKSGFEEVELQYRQHKDDINSLAEEADPIKVSYGENVMYLFDSLPLPPQQEELSKSDQVVEKSKHNKKHYEEKRKEHLSHIQDLKKSLGDKEHEIENSITKALEICPERSDVRRTAKSLDSEISRLKLKISTQQDQHGDRDTILRQYQDALQSYNGAALQVKGLKSFITLLGNIMNKRHNIYTEMRRYLSVRCKYYFDSMLSQRGYTGKMTFSHKDETLSISVQPGENAKAALSDMRSLSGGERSFSTVCFVLSLWAIAEAPFRCLDEFDVYMDMVNRRISMDMMLKIAASQRYRQFIFLTPQSMRHFHIVTRMPAKSSYSYFYLVNICFKYLV